MFFSKPGEYDACGMFSMEHLILLIITSIGIKLALKHTKFSDKTCIRKIIRNVVILVWVLEIIKIIFNLIIGNGNNINTYIPLYYCSILLYAGILSLLGKGILKRTGDVFLATGGLVAGITFLIFPSTSLGIYPVFHYISFQSFIYHGLMIYLGIVINKSKYIELRKKDIIYYFCLIMIIGLIALIINSKFGSNLMFISEDFPNTPVSIIYNLSGKLFTTLMLLVHSILPFYIVYIALKKIQTAEINNKDNLEEQDSNLDSHLSKV